MPASRPPVQNQPSNQNRVMQATQPEAAAAYTFAPPAALVQRAMDDPRQMRPLEVMQLQRSIGNHAVSQMLTPPGVQAQLRVGPVGDRYEQEADRVASEVMRKPIAPVTHKQQERKQAEREEGEGAAFAGPGAVQRMPAPPKITPLVQRAASGHGHGCGCKSCSSAQRQAVQRQAVQRHHDEEEVQRSAHGKGCNCAACNTAQRQSVQRTAVQRHLDQAVRLQRSTPAKDGSFEADAGLEGRVKQLAGRGRPLGEPVRREMETRFGGTDFSRVRVHTGAEAGTLNRSMQANAFTHHHDIAFALGKFNPGTQQGKQLLAHELTHTIQQTGGTPVQRSFADVYAKGGHGRGCGCSSCHSATPKISGDVQRSGVVQRHASFEHRMLGDVNPDDLASLGTWQDPDPTTQEGEVDLGALKVKKANLKHIIAQELRRLKAWQTNPPRGATKEDEDQLMGEDDKAWQVKLVSIPSTAKTPGAPLIVTYGELNTLADFYGSVEELKAADPTKRWNVAQSVRNQSYEKLFGMYMKLTKKSEDDVKEKLGIKGLAFAGSFNITDAIAGEVAQMMKDKKGQLDKYSAYGATLARNACHFAPESWHSWEDYHAKGLKVAKEAYDLSQTEEEEPEGGHDEGSMQIVPFSEGVMSGMVGGLGSGSQPKQVSPPPKKGSTLKDKVEAKVNEALLFNGFGDHYLQDSYAAGHLINKTQIMQWFVQWLDKDPDKLTYTTDTSWRQFQAMSYDQGGVSDRGQYKKRNVGRRNIKGQQVSTARNPQLVENTQESSKDQNIGWEGRFEMLGLKTPQSIQAGSPALKLLLWLQRNSNYLSTWSWKELKEKSKPAAPKGFFARMTTVKDVPPHLMSEPDLRQGLTDLLNEQIVFTPDGSRQVIGRHKKHNRGQGNLPNYFVDTVRFELRKEWIVSTIGGGDFKKAATNAEGGDMTGYNKMMKATVYKDYVKFMQDAFLQKSTNALHDYFCINGLDVVGADGHTVFKIYGDNNMLNKESSKGVKESAETSRMSRDSIMAMAMGGTEPVGKTTRNILDRFPNKVQLASGAQVSLAKWHNDGELKKVAEEKVFPTLNTAKDFMAGVTSGKALGAITKDEEVHGSESF